jgi:2-oxoglutarate/2-oxoacid ferredoxin oxidoreductase subunit beta
LHDNHVYGLTKKQASPTSPRGFKSNTTPYGAVLEPLNPLTTSLSVSNVSFIAQAVDWIPEMLYDIIYKAYHHKGFSLVRVLQRCPEFLPHLFDPFVRDPMSTRILTHEDGVQLSPALSKTYRNQEVHDPLDIHRAREISSLTEEIPVGILYCNEQVPCYEDLREGERPNTPGLIRTVLDEEMDKFTIWPDDRAEATAN